MAAIQTLKGGLLSILEWFLAKFTIIVNQIAGKGIKNGACGIGSEGWGESGR